MLELQLENPEGPARRPNHSPAHEHVQPAVTAAIAGPFALGRLARPERTAAILPALWVAGAVALGAAVRLARRRGRSGRAPRVLGDRAGPPRVGAAPPEPTRPPGAPREPPAGALPSSRIHGSRRG